MANNLSVIDSDILIDVGRNIKTAIELLKEYKLSHGLLIADSFIASTALILDSPLLTKNQKDFKYIKGLKLLKDP